MREHLGSEARARLGQQPQVVHPFVRTYPVDVRGDAPLHTIDKEAS